MTLFKLRFNDGCRIMDPVNEKEDAKLKKY